MKKNLLVVSRSFYPENTPRSNRTTELVKELTRRGHEVTLLTLKNEVHKQFETKYKVKIKDLGKLKYPVIQFDRGSRILRLLKRAIRRLALLIFEYPDIELTFKVRNALKQETGYDLLLSIAAPHTVHWGVALAGKNLKDIAKIWVADCGDPYMGATTDSFKKLFYFKYIEKWWCRKADYITVPFEGAKEGYYPEFRDKIRVIPQGFDFNELSIDSKAYSPHKIPTFAYSGLLIPGSRDPAPLVDHLLGLGIDFKFILYNKQSYMFADMIKKAGSKVEFRDYIPRPQLMQELSSMDFLVNFNNKVSTQLPSKLIDYYLTQRPVLSLSSYELDKKVITEFLNGDYTNRYEFEHPEQYRIENVSNAFLKLI